MLFTFPEMLSSFFLSVVILLLMVISKAESVSSSCTPFRNSITSLKLSIAVEASPLTRVFNCCCRLPNSVRKLLSAPSLLLFSVFRAVCRLPNAVCNAWICPSCVPSLLSVLFARVKSPAIKSAASCKAPPTRAAVFSPTCVALATKLAFCFKLSIVAIC